MLQTVTSATHVLLFDVLPSKSITCPTLCLIIDIKNV